MPRTLAAIRVIIKDGPQFKYPEFNTLDVVKTFIEKNPGKDWSNYIDVEGTGWCYDNEGGADFDDGETAAGLWCACVLIPLEFARQAIVAFPTLIERMTEAAWETFYNTRFAKEFQDEEINLEVVQAIKLKQDLGLPLTRQQTAALDPSNSERGIRKNNRKLWADYKADRGIIIIDGR